MQWADFKQKWSRYQGKETSAYQEHFTDLCRLLNHPTPAAADPTGTQSFCFQKRVVKDAELFAFREDGSVAETEEEAKRGFADVWKKDFFGWEYKGKRRSLDEAYKQLLRYRESLLNPPLLVVCDFDRYIVRTNFNGTVQETFEFTNDQIDHPENLRILHATFENPEYLKPQHTTNEITKALAEKFSLVARSPVKRESAELADDMQPLPLPEPAELNGGLRKMVARRFLEVKEEPPPFGSETSRQLTRSQHQATIAAAAKELSDLRERWLIPPEWTVEKVLEFPATVGGPWSRYVVPSTLNPQLSTALVRYPRLEPRDAECAGKLKKRTLTNLYNERPAWLDLTHKKLDAAVAAAYGWPADLSDDQILERLLALNLERAAEEAKAQQSPDRKPAQRHKAEHEML